MGYLKLDTLWHNYSKSLAGSNTAAATCFLYNGNYDIIELILLKGCRGAMIDKILKLASASMSMSEEVWFRHANPWSGLTRFATYPFVVLAFWSRAWIGIWFLIPVAIVFIWAWLNPRIFPKPKSTNNWMSKGVFGEKIFTERKKIKTQVPSHHVIVANITIMLTTIGAAILIYGLVVLEIWPTVAGAVIAFLGKVWYVDRMVWLYEDMKHIPEYKEWLY